MTEPLIYESSSSGRCGVFLPELDVPRSALPEEYLRDDLPLPEVSEVDLVRHYMRLSQFNWGVDIGFYPLGSCTMKYNPKVNEEAARLPGFVRTHPYQDHCSVQGNLQLMYELQEFLKELGGFAGVSLQPAAGSHGEFTGILMVRAYHEERGDKERNVILIPDSAHGTNPASTTMSGYTMVELKSDERGNVDLEDLKAHCDERVAGLMLTNPNTLGLFDEHLLEVCQLVHDCGGLVYGDGANFNAIMGICKQVDLGFDVMHYNLHKTFSTPHGGGGPGAGPVGANEKLAPYLPGPIAVKDGPFDPSTLRLRSGQALLRTGSAQGRECDCGCEHEEHCYHLVMPEKSIGRIKSFYGNFGVFVKAYTYIRMLGAEGLKQASQDAVLNANYLRARLKGLYPMSHDRICMHEFVAMARIGGAPDVHAIDIAKRLMDYRFHPPTTYFPLIVPEALMIEPTETESKETLDAFANALIQIADEAVRDPELLHHAPHTTPVGRLDEVKAAREPILRYTPE